MVADLGYALDIVIKMLLVIVLLFVSILVYRLDRIMASGEKSAERIEKTAENVERSSEAFLGLVAILEKVPFLGSDKKGEKKDE